MILFVVVVIVTAAELEFGKDDAGKRGMPIARDHRVDDLRHAFHIEALVHLTQGGYPYQGYLIEKVHAIVLLALAPGLPNPRHTDGPTQVWFLHCRLCSKGQEDIAMWGTQPDKAVGLGLLFPAPPLSSR